MKKRLFSLLLVSALVFTLSGCGEKSLLRENDPVTLNFWHVYGEQSGSPMDLLVQEFNRTVGQEKGVRVQVTNLSSASKIGGLPQGSPEGRQRRTGNARSVHLPHQRRHGAGLGQSGRLERPVYSRGAL